MARKIPLTDDVITNLINEVRTTGQCIWNTDDERYNDRFHILYTWREISQKTKIPEDVIKIKWKNLRDLFKRELKKFSPTSLETYGGKWRHFKAMWFLYRPELSINQSSQTNDDSNEEQFDETTVDIDVDEENIETFIKCEPIDKNDLTETFLEDPINTMPKKRKRDEEDDYDVMFLKSLTPYFKQLDPMRKLIMRSKMQDMLLNEIAAQTQHRERAGQ